MVFVHFVIFFTEISCALEFWPVDFWSLSRYDLIDFVRHLWALPNRDHFKYILDLKFYKTTWEMWPYMDHCYKFSVKLPPATPQLPKLNQCLNFIKWQRSSFRLLSLGRPQALFPVSCALTHLSKEVNANQFGQIPLGWRLALNLANTCIPDLISFLVSVYSLLSCQTNDTFWKIFLNTHFPPDFFLSKRVIRDISLVQPYCQKGKCWFYS